VTLAADDAGVIAGARPGMPRPGLLSQIEESLSEKILFSEVKAGQIVTVGAAGTGPEAQFTFEGVPRPGEVPDMPPAEIASESKAAAGATDGRLANGE
jgi:ATP-dependent Clp protease ATP-binding subunit ClpC